MAARHASVHALPRSQWPPLGPGHSRYEGRRRHGLNRYRTADGSGLVAPRNHLSCSTATKRSAVLLRGPSPRNLARQCSAVYVLEPAQGLAYKTARKGIGDWHIQVKGVAAHAGVDFEKGANALRELARVIETVSGWTDLKRGLTVSVGVAAGGTKSNVVPAHAQADIDVRIPRMADAARITRKFAALRPADPRCTLIVTGGINRPPMERSRGTVRLFRKAHLLAARTRFELNEASTGGGSDGNFTAALGIPTLDGMGAVGEGAHARHESVFIEHLAPRTALLAAMLLR